MFFPVQRVIVVFAATLILAGFLSACGPGTRPLTPLKPDAVVLAFGDSLTYGTGADREASYPAILERLIQRKVINAGVPGEVTSQGLERLPAVLDQVHPALLILCHGGNDFLQKTGEPEVADNLRSMIRIAKDRGTEVVLIGVPQPGLILSSARCYPEIAREFRIPYEGTILPAILSKGPLKSDTIHPNAEGYQQMAEAIARLLRKEKAIP